MKTITETKEFTIEDLYECLTEHLNSEFAERRLCDLHFNITQHGNTVTIDKPGLYEDHLFKLTVQQPGQLQVEKSEHYVDDVNVLTLEAILDEIFVKLLGATAPQL